MVPQNVSFLMKLAYQLVTNPEALRVKFCEVSTGCFRENLCWSIGDGQPDSLLHDAWISDLGLLSNHLLNVPYIPTHAKVVDFVDTDGKWKWIDLQRFFSREVLEHIVACHPPCDELGEDKCLWRSNASGKFSDYLQMLKGLKEGCRMTLAARFVGVSKKQIYMY
ncbi:hypothetical protein Goari_013899 [Gossypium aridum]|uniref:Uncharacterized protein n=1 Tax=Gossypium aridum TaxID=34290 RepID=A0A7J8XGQ3_GOSAI|nr:hypothetical protein [Gossypium aridum]